MKHIKINQVAFSLSQQEFIQFASVTLRTVGQYMKQPLLQVPFLIGQRVVVEGGMHILYNSKLNTKVTEGLVNNEVSTQPSLPWQKFICTSLQIQDNSFLAVNLEKRLSKMNALQKGDRG